MNKLLEFIGTDNFLLISFILNIFLIISTFILIFLVIRNNNKYIKFMKKIGNGNNIDEMLKVYIQEVNNIKKDNSEIKAYYTKLDDDISKCIQKIGVVRYNAFRDVGGDLSFTMALMDREDNGIVLNGIYGSESSNIYAKPIKDGISTYQLSEEEKYAIELAKQPKRRKK